MPGGWRTPINLVYVWDNRCWNSTPREPRASARDSSGGRLAHGTWVVPARHGRHDGHFEDLNVLDERHGLRSLAGAAAQMCALHRFGVTAFKSLMTVHNSTRSLCNDRYFVTSTRSRTRKP